MTRIGIIIGSTRPVRNGEQVAAWVHDLASQRTDAEFELIDLRGQRLPLLDEPKPAMWGDYRHEHTKAWSARIAEFDGFVVVTPEYNGTAPGALINAFDYLFAEWADKPIGLVSYGVLGGARAAEQLRLMCGTLQMAVMGPQVLLSFATDFEDQTAFRPTERSVAALTALLDKTVTWSIMLAKLRETALAAA
ncbi:NADPH-dependent FMN reductase [Glycomyces arizonensis]|uniref:NADPH-dependent FMN reductase n=1 Tax=Glycomyces arizonensis TaxID=256035 RepID=UPI0003FCE7AF|nr:NAD(P)H-dependent oxidoreductase [Glycomyces arizonensis]